MYSFDLRRACCSLWLPWHWDFSNSINSIDYQSDRAYADDSNVIVNHRPWSNWSWATCISANLWKLSSLSLQLLCYNKTLYPAKCNYELCPCLLPIEIAPKYPLVTMYLWSRACLQQRQASSQEQWFDRKFSSSGVSPRWDKAHDS